MGGNRLDRLWDRLVSRYEQDSDADCCNVDIEEARSDSSGTESNDCCD